MSAFKRFGPGDQIDNVLVLEPDWELVSGSSGWRGSPEGSASVSLFGGYNRQPGGVVRSYEYERMIQGTNSFGKLVRTEPLTASVHYAWLTNEELSLGERTGERWGYDHWKTVMRLYDYYSRRDPDYVTSSYDHYCLYFNSGSTNIVSMLDRTSSAPVLYKSLPTGSYTIEAWFKPFTTGTAVSNLTVLSKARAYKLFVDGSSGKLVWAIHSGTTAVRTALTGTTSVTPGAWHHAAVTFDATTRSGTMYLDLREEGTFGWTAGGIPNPINYTGSFHIGAEWGGTVTQQGVMNPTFRENPTVSAIGLAGTVFQGFIGQVRVWGVKKTFADISASHNMRLTGSALGAPLLSDIRLSEGPLVQGPLTDVVGSGPTYQATGPGSGVFDYAAQYQNGSSTPFYGNLYSFNSRPGPVWHPNDNDAFYLPKAFVSAPSPGTNWTGSLLSSIDRMRVISVPTGFYGRQITPGSVRITDRAWSNPTYGLIRTLIDDGRGGLFLSGSACSSSIDSSGEQTIEQYRGVEWNKVGNVFYDEGLIVIRDPSLLDFGEPTAHVSSHPNDLLQVGFRGNSRIPVKTLMCRIDRGDLNASLNQTFWREEEDGDRIRRHPSGSLYVTTVGIYNSDRELVGIARLAEPLRVRTRDRMNVKLRMDF